MEMGKDKSVPISEMFTGESNSILRYLICFELFDSNDNLLYHPL